MKRLATMFLALSFLAGTAVVSFAQDAPPKKEKKKSSKKKKEQKEEKKG
jgi:hypothetical protein